VIYVDASVALAHLFAEDRAPSNDFWYELLVASRLLEYEVWNRLHASGLGPSSRAAAHGLLEGIDLLDLSPEILHRALEPFPIPVRTLDALHLATIDFLPRQGSPVELAAYDRRLAAAAQTLGIALYGADAR
jgi:hypothetical protein